MGRRATEIRKGHIVEMDGGLWQVVDFDHHTPGNLRAIINIKFKNILTGATKAQRYASGDVLEVAFLDNKECQYLYRDLASGAFVFMDLETFEQYEIEPDLVGDGMRFVVEQQNVQLKFHQGVPLTIELPSTVVLKVVEAEGGAKGNTVSNVFKRAVLETGLEIKVPMHIDAGELVKVSTQTGEFQGRAKE